MISDDVSRMTFISSWTPNNFAKLPIINVELYGLVLAQGWKKDTIKLGNQSATLGADKTFMVLWVWRWVVKIFLLMVVRDASCNHKDKKFASWQKRLFFCLVRVPNHENNEWQGMAFETTWNKGVTLKVLGTYCESYYFLIWKND
jgi:hypothetical protein